MNRLLKDIGKKASISLQNAMIFILFITITGCVPAQIINPAPTIKLPTPTSEATEKATEILCSDELIQIPGLHAQLTGWSKDSKTLFLLTQSAISQSVYMRYSVDDNKSYMDEAPTITPLQIYFTNEKTEGRMDNNAFISLSPKGDKAIYAIFRFTEPTPSPEPCTTPPYCGGETEGVDSTNDFFYIEELNLTPVYLGSARGSPNSFHWFTSEESGILSFTIGPSLADYNSGVLNIKAKTMEPFLPEEGNLIVKSISPDGKWVLYKPVEHLLGTPWVINMNDGTKFKLPEILNLVSSENGEWIPGTDKLIYLRLTSSDIQIGSAFMFDFLTQKETPITNLTFSTILEEMMSPDNSMIAFQDFFQNQIYILKICLNEYLEK
jgi:hypothetical protein